MTITEKTKDLLQRGIFQAIADGKELEQRIKCGCDGREEFPYSREWHSWQHSITILFDDGWAVRVKPKPREFWIASCPKHGPIHKVFSNHPPKSECEHCEITHVIEVNP